MHNGYQESSPHRLPGEDKDKASTHQTDQQNTIASLEAEKQELKAEILQVQQMLSGGVLTARLGLLRVGRAFVTGQHVKTKFNFISLLQEI